MPHDYTQTQSPDDEARSQQLSLQHTRPPTEVPGYRTERFLGAGAYGEVWVGVDNNTGRRVAIKFYAHRHGVDWSLLSREVEKLVFLSTDRYVVQLLEVGWDAEPPYYVMEFLEHGSLEDWLRAQGPLPPHEAVELFTEICQGLSHAHGKGVLHCDLKPANILLDQDRQPRLADFGQSRLSSEQTPALGTLFYMAPEQADLAALPDARWDVYALGAILHCLLVGEPPFRNATLIAELDTASDLSDRLARYRRAMQLSPPLSQRKFSGVDRALRDILERCLAIDPQERFANVQEVLSALAARQRQRQMRPVLAFGIAFPILLLIVMTIFGLRGYERALRDTEELSKRRAVENNKFAAELAAERVAAEIERYFEIASAEAHREAFTEHFNTVRKNPLLSQLASVPMESARLERLREDFLSDSKRQDMNSYLERRLRRYRRHPKLASIMVIDAEGTMLAAAYEGQDSAPTIGHNFAYRSYFHGGPADLPTTTRTPAVKPVQETHLSAVFQSTLSNKWRVAVATPIWRDVPDSEEEHVAGLLVLTLNLGDFEFFKAIQSEGKDRLAVLVDGRPGDHTGVILQHPLFEHELLAGKPLPPSFLNMRVPLMKDGTLPANEYHDPLAQEPLGSDFQRAWLASAAPVRSVNPEDDSNGQKTSGLVVLVQEDYLAVISPVRQLGERLVREGLWALAVVLFVTVMLWIMVLRIARGPRSFARALPPVPRTATPIPLEATITMRPSQHEPGK